MFRFLRGYIIKVHITGEWCEVLLNIIGMLTAYIVIYSVTNL